MKIYAGWWEAGAILQCNVPQAEFFSGQMEVSLDKDLWEVASMGEGGAFIQIKFAA